MPPLTVDALGDRTMEAVKETAERTGFWLAIALPLVYLPLLSDGIADLRELTAVVALLLVHLAALAVGHRYNRD